jgi:hypothetical protein
MLTGLRQRGVRSTGDCVKHLRRRRRRRNGNVVIVLIGGDTLLSGIGCE